MGAFAFSNGALGIIAQNWWSFLRDDGGLQIALFANDVTPEPGYDEGLFIEPTFTGYARVDVDSINWPQALVGNEVIITCPTTATFTTPDTPGQVVYGYWMWEDSSGFSPWAQRFDNPVTVVSGLPLIFTPRNKFKNCPDQ